MSEGEITGFDAGKVARAVRQPPLDDLLAVVRERRRRRTAGVALAVVLAIAGMAVVPLTGRSSGVDWAAPEPTVTRDDRTTRLFVLSDTHAVGVAWVDHGCTVRFAHTLNAGRSWSDYASASYRVPDCRTKDDGEKVGDLRFSVLDERSYLVLHNGRRYLSSDYGHSWRDADTAMVSVAAFPDRARPVFCQQGCDAVLEPLATDPETGTVYRLRGEKPSPYPPFSIYPSPDGAIWATYWPGESGRRAIVASSADRGATWRTSTPAGGHVVAVAAVSEVEAYLLTEPDPPPGTEPMEPGVPSRLLHTTDGGRSWTDVGTDLPSTPVSRDFTLAADGSLMIADTHHHPANLTAYLLVSRDGGRHFARVREYGQEGGTGVAPGRAWLHGRDDMSVEGPDHVQLTTDGEDWVRFALPG
ncbi:hypothetical protein [Micromonospora sp. NPDC126480]|uniref:hypothetical protein n=1 Tax=Micromonospora sp. NPDC126480 TaxID=3155312 RepID=UPI00331FB294